MFSPGALEAVAVLVLHVPEHVPGRAQDRVAEVVRGRSCPSPPASDRAQRRVELEGLVAGRGTGLVLERDQQRLRAGVEAVVVPRVTARGAASRPTEVIENARATMTVRRGSTIGAARRERRDIGLGSLGSGVSEPGHRLATDPAASWCLHPPRNGPDRDRHGVPVSDPNRTLPHRAALVHVPAWVLRLQTVPGRCVRTIASGTLRWPLARRARGRGRASHGGLSSIGRALDCGSRGYGFEPRRPPHSPARPSGMERH